MSVDSENQKILQEFMDVLDNEEEEEEVPPPKVIHQKQVPNFSKPTQNVHNLSSGQIYPQKQVKKNGNYPTSSKQIFSTNVINTSYEQSSPSKKPNPQQTSFLKEGKPAKKQEIENIKGSNFSSQSMGGPNYDVRDNSEFWRASADLQDRVKKAIEKSMDVIQRFKTIKEHFP